MQGLAINKEVTFWQEKWADLNEKYTELVDEVSSMKVTPNKEQEKKEGRCCDACMASNCLGPVPVDDGADMLGVSMPGLTILNSKSRGGKSHLERYIFWKNQHRLHLGISFSNTGRERNNLDWVPPEFKHFKFDETILRAFLALMKTLPPETLGFVLIDDDMTGFNSPALLEAATQTYHNNIWVIITTQHVNKIPPSIREQAFQVALFKMETKRNLTAAYESYGQDFYDQKKFESYVMDPKYTGDHRFLWKDKSQDKPWKCLRCPPIIPEFKLKYGSFK